MNELFNVTYSEVQTYQFPSKIYKIVLNFKIVLKSVKDVIVSRFTALCNSRLVFQKFSNFVYQICFEILIYCDSTNKTILININLAHFFFVSISHVHFSQLSLIALFSHSFSSLLTIIFIDVIISLILTSATFRYSLFISFIYMTSFIFAFKEINFVIFCFYIHFERKIIKIMFIKIFDY